MKHRPWEEEPREPSGRCRYCGATYIDVYDYAGDPLPGYIPVRLEVFNEEGPMTIAEWCSRSCMQRDLSGPTTGPTGPEARA